MSQENEVFARSQNSYCSPTNANSYNTVTSPCSSSTSYPVYTSFTVTTAANLVQEHYGYSHHSVIAASPTITTTPSAANPTAIPPYIQGNHQHSSTSLTHHPTHLTRSNSYTYYAPVPLDHLPSPNSYPLPTPPLTAPIHPLRSYFFPTVVGHQQFKGVDEGIPKPQSATMLSPADGGSYSNHETLATALLQLQDPVIRTSVPSAIVSLPAPSPSMSSPPVSTFSNVPYSVQSPWRPSWPYLPIMQQQEYRGNPCHICGKTYARLSTLRSHLKSHTGEKPYQCSICQKSFTQAANLTAHLRTHSGEKPFKCPVCHRGFSQSSSVTTHMRTHSGDRPYKCNVCSKGFADSSTLTKHYRTHTGEKPYQCKVCEARFSQSGNLNRHMRTHQQHFGIQHIQEPMSMTGVGGRNMGEYSETDSMGSTSTSDITKMEMVVLNEGGRVSM